MSMQRKMANASSSARSLFAPRYLLAAVILMVLVVGLYAFIEARRVQRELQREMEERGLSLLEALEASSKNAIASNVLLEDLIGQRLLDNARLIDQLIARGAYDDQLLQHIVAQNRLQKVELLDKEGKPYHPQLAAPRPAPRMGVGTMQCWHRGMGPQPGKPGGSPEQAPRWGMPFMWGHRWPFQERKPAEPQDLPKALQERRFWEGSAFGVAVEAGSFPGLIIVHADAKFLLNFREQIGIQRLMEDLAKHSGVAFISLQDGDLRILSHSDPQKVGRIERDPFLAEAWERREVRGRVLALPEKGRVYEVVKPFAFSGSNLGILRLGLSIEPMEQVWRQDRRVMFLFTGGILLVGILGVLGIFLNQRRYLMKMKTLEEAAERGERLSALGNLAAGVAHEVRNPLNAIAMGLQRMRREFQPAAEDRAEYDRFVAIMEGEVKRLNGIIDRFLQLARPAKLVLAECNLEELLGELVTLVEGEAAGRGIRVRKEIALDHLKVIIDPAQIKQVLVNILNNAIQAMPQGGNLTISSRVISGQWPVVSEGRRTTWLITGHRSPATFVEIAIADTGQGIPPEHLGRIFEPYFTTKEGGTGLGLAIARRIVEEHGGRIEVESKAGRGTTFRLLFPLRG